jgi:Na+/melibiose symporter-like transporter
LVVAAPGLTDHLATTSLPRFAAPQSTDTYKDGYMLSALIFGIFIIFPPWVTFFTNKERYQRSQVDPSSHWAS